MQVHRSNVIRLVSLVGILLAAALLSTGYAAPRFGPGQIVGLVNSPHLFVADDAGVLHWAGDTRALVGRTVDWSTPITLTRDELRGVQIGDPWLSAGLLKDGDPIYLVKWETGQTPALLHIQSIGDVALFGINAGNYGRFVLDRANWEQQYGSTTGLERRELEAARVPPTAVPTVAPAYVPAIPQPARASGGGGGGGGGSSGQAAPAPTDTPAPSATPTATATSTPTTSPTASVTATVTATATKLAIFVFAGQSNIVGQGALPPPEPIDPRVFFFNLQQGWQPAREPMHLEGYSSATTFGKALVARDPSLRVGLVPCGQDGSFIEEWQPGGRFFDLCVTRTKMVMGLAPGSYLAGIIWYQGESDAQPPILVALPHVAHATDWDTQFSRTVSGFRSELGNAPVVYAQLATWRSLIVNQYANWEIVKARQVAARSISRTVMVRTEDLVVPDGVHLDTASQRVLGQRFADAYLTLR